MSGIAGEYGIVSEDAMFGGIAMLLVGAPMGVQSLNRQRHFARAMSDDLRDGLVECYAAPGDVPFPVVLVPGLVAGDRELCKLEVLPRSRLVLSLNDEQPRRLLRVSEVQTAAVPGSMTAPLAANLSGAPRAWSQIAKMDDLRSSRDVLLAWSGCSSPAASGV